MIRGFRVWTERGDDLASGSVTIGYATGEANDIRRYYDDRKNYKIFLDPIAIVHVTPDAIEQRKNDLIELSQLEKRVEALRESTTR